MKKRVIPWRHPHFWTKSLSLTALDRVALSIGDVRLTTG
jgi:hypothetical protein